MSRFELPVEEQPISRESLSRKGLADAAVMQNAVWFVTLRFYVVSVFLAFGLIGWLAGGRLREAGLAIPYRMLWALSVVLLAANLILRAIVRRFDETTLRRSVLRSIWAQISLDLLGITVLVYVIGPVETFAPFTYLFHIVLACIFFPPKESLLVTAVAALLYLGLICLQAFGAIAQRSMLVAGTLAEGPFVRISLAVFGVTIWLIVWYITSTLSRTVRLRDQQLSMMNDRLIAANEEKNRQMLITTHDLKAPFAGIESNIQVLRYQYWGEIPEKIRLIIERIDARAHMLRDRINAILVLGDLKSKSAEEVNSGSIDLADLIGSVVEPLHEKAGQVEVSIDCRVPHLEVESDRGQLAMVFENLISNAIVYSKHGGTVTITAEKSPDGIAVSIRDQGIGIRADALPQIFDEYYRTQEASRHNRQSTGLGLAIVKVIAHRLKLRVEVVSEVGEGTEFTVTIP